MSFEQEKITPEKLSGGEVKKQQKEHAAQMEDEKIVERSGLTTARFFQRLRTRVNSFFTGKTTNDTNVDADVEEKSTQDIPRRQPLT